MHRAGVDNRTLVADLRVLGGGQYELAVAAQLSGVDLAQVLVPADGKDFTLASMSVTRYCFDLSDWDNSGWTSPLGASGHPGSHHYADQITAWSTQQLHPMLYSWDRIEAAAETRQHLEPS